MTITGQSALPKEEIDRMIRDAEKYAEEDRKAREAAEIRNQADNMLFQSESLAKEDAITAEQKARLEEAQSTLRSALDGDDTDAIKDATEALMRVSQEIGQAMYAATADQGVPGAGATPPPDDDEEIVDAEVVDDEDEGAA